MDPSAFMKERKVSRRTPSSTRPMDGQPANRPPPHPLPMTACAYAAFVKGKGPWLSKKLDGQ